ncbi:hypothetical protein V5O48_009685 [Marasmius crinis-equi]|uniref:Uncharacterized protein n=1 Tax=Marasmius crinis-equi TaxID=585013 RepID=A0ABR3FAF1_9AGAR
MTYTYGSYPTAPAASQHLPPSYSKSSSHSRYPASLSSPSSSSSSTFTLSEHSKNALATKLRHGHQKWVNMPPGFPFRLTMDPYTGGPAISYESYEFHEDIRTNSGHTVSVKFEYTRRSKHFAWKIYPEDTRFYSHHRPAQNAIAHVEVDAAVMDTTYGKLLRHDSRVISTALASSLELGVMITICEADKLRTSRRFPHLRRSTKFPGPFYSTSIVHVVTDASGGSEVVQVWHPSS